MAYDIADTPIGPLLVAVTDRGLARISFDPDRGASDQLARVVRPAGAPRAARGRRRAPPQLDEYFEGSRTTSTSPIDLGCASDFSRAVLAELARVPVRPG